MSSLKNRATGVDAGAVSVENIVLKQWTDLNKNRTVNLQQVRFFKLFGKYLIFLCKKFEFGRNIKLCWYNALAVVDILVLFRGPSFLLFFFFKRIL